MAAAALLFFVYLGFEQVANLAEEVRHPGRDLPRALFGSIAITTVLYVLVALSVVHLAPPVELAASEAPLATAIHTVWPGAGVLLSAIALFATANTVLITLIAASRLAFAMARDGEILGVFASVLPRRQTPWAAAVLALVLSASLLPIGSVRLLAEMSSFAALLAFLAVNVVLIVLRYKLPHHPRPFRAPGAIGRLPVLPVLAIASIALLLIHFEWRIYLAGGIALALSVVVFLARHGLRRGGRWLRARRPAR
jgi:amino acid transporter